MQKGFDTMDKKKTVTISPAEGKLGRIKELWSRNSL